MAYPGFWFGGGTFLGVGLVGGPGAEPLRMQGNFQKCSNKLLKKIAKNSLV